MPILTYHNYTRGQSERIDTDRLDDTKAMQLIPQDRTTQDIYVYARRTGASIGEAMSRALLEGKR